MSFAHSSVFGSSLQPRSKAVRSATRQKRSAPRASLPTLVSDILLGRERELEDRLHRVKNDLRLIAFTRATTKSQSTRRACLLRAAIHSRRRKAIESRLSHVRKIREDALRVEALRSEARSEMEHYGVVECDEELDEVALREGWNEVVDKFEDLKRDITDVSERLALDWSGIDDAELEEELDEEMNENRRNKKVSNIGAESSVDEEWCERMQNPMDCVLGETEEEQVDENAQLLSEEQRVHDLLPTGRHVGL